MKLIHLVKTHKQLISDHQQLRKEYEEFKRQEKIKVEQSLQKIYPYLPLLSSPVEYKGKPLMHEGIFLFTHRYFNYYLLEDKTFVSLKDNRRRPVESRIFDNLSLEEIINIQGYEILKNLYESIGKIFEDLQSLTISSPEEKPNTQNSNLNENTLKKEVQKPSNSHNQSGENTSKHSRPNEREIKPQGKEVKTSPSSKPSDIDDDSEPDKAKQQEVKSKITKPVQPTTSTKVDKSINSTVEVKKEESSPKKVQQQKPIDESTKTDKSNITKNEPLRTTEEKKEVSPSPKPTPSKVDTEIVKVQESKDSDKQKTVIDSNIKETPIVVDLVESPSVEETSTKKDTLLSGELILDFSMLSDTTSSQKEEDEKFELPSALTAKKGQQQSLELDFELEFELEENKNTEAKILEDLSDLDDGNENQQGFFDLTQHQVEEKPRTIIDLTIAHKNKLKEEEEDEVEEDITPQGQTIIDLENIEFKDGDSYEEPLVTDLPTDDFTEFKPYEEPVSDFVDEYQSDSIDDMYDNEFPDNLEDNLNDGLEDVEIHYIDDEEEDSGVDKEEITNYDEDNLDSEDDEDDDFNL